MPIARFASYVEQVPFYSVIHPKEGGKEYLCNDNTRHRGPFDYCVFQRHENNEKKFQIVREKDNWRAGDDGRYIRFFVCTLWHSVFNATAGACSLTLSQPPENTSVNTWFELNTTARERWEYILIGGKWLCLNELEGTSYLNTINLGKYALSHSYGGNVGRTNHVALENEC